jgi:hypothetical protein
VRKTNEVRKMGNLKNNFISCKISKIDVVINFQKIIGTHSNNILILFLSINKYEHGDISKIKSRKLEKYYFKIN